MHQNVGHISYNNVVMIGNSAVEPSTGLYSLCYFAYRPLNNKSHPVIGNSYLVVIASNE